jgi:hypothetical protein
MRIIIIILIYFLLPIFLSAQDTSFCKEYYSGSKARVPNGKLWFIEKVCISNGDGFNIIISKTNFKESYLEGELISFPYYLPEMELLSKLGSVSYLINITQKDRE